MVWTDIFTNFLNPVLHPLVEIHPFFAVVIVSFLVAWFNAWIYKKFTDQHKMKALKDEMKRMQTEVRKYKENASKMMEIQGKLMQKNLEYMKQSFKPTLITMIPILIIFGWMTGHLAYDPIIPNVPVNVTVFMAKAENGSVQIQVPMGLQVLGEKTQEIDPKTHTVMWAVKGKSGDYRMDFIKDGETVSQRILITEGLDYAKTDVRFSSDAFVHSIIHNEHKVILDIGFYKMGYLLTYLLTAVLFSLGIRKAMKLY